MIVGALALQLTASFRLVFPPIGPPPYLYPFIDYPMYNSPKYEGDAVDRKRVVAILDDGVERRVSPADVGMGFWLFQKEVVQALEKADLERLRLYAELLERRHDISPVAFRLESEPLLLTEGGIRAGSPRVVRHVAVPRE